MIAAPPVVAHVLAVVDAGRIDGAGPLHAARGRRAEVVYEWVPIESLPAAAADGGGADAVDSAAAGALARAALRYDQVLCELVLDGPVLPVRLGTTAQDASTLTRFVQRHDEALGAELDRVRDLREWHVRARRIEPATPSSEARRDGPDQETGTQYLLRARDRFAAPADGAGQAQRALRSAAERIDGFAVESDGSLDLRGSRRAYLLRRSDEPRMTAVLDGLAAEHAGALAVELTGPLPPYSFIRLPLEDAP